MDPDWSGGRQNLGPSCTRTHSLGGLLPASFSWQLWRRHLKKEKDVLLIEKASREREREKSSDRRITWREICAVGELRRWLCDDLSHNCEQAAIMLQKMGTIDKAVADLAG